MEDTSELVKSKFGCDNCGAQFAKSHKPSLKMKNTNVGVKAYRFDDDPMPVSIWCPKCNTYSKVTFYGN